MDMFDNLIEDMADEDCTGKRRVRINLEGLLKATSLYAFAAGKRTLGSGKMRRDLNIYVLDFGSASEACLRDITSELSMR
jgi:hypothetical protein